MKGESRRQAKKWISSVQSWENGNKGRGKKDRGEGNKNKQKKGERKLA